MTRHLVAATLLLLAAGSANTAAAQARALSAGIARSRDASGTDSARPHMAAPRGLLTARDSAWWVPLTSSLIPGYGQRLLGQDRFIAYLAIEAYALAGYFAGESAVRRERDRYLALARDVARAFVPGNTAIGDWDYYESMEKHIESGVFDRTPGTGTFTPEPNIETLNGKTWLLARQLSNWDDPNVEPDHASAAYRDAIAFYQGRAVRPEFVWSWRNHQLEWNVYGQGIRRKNDASREARQYLTVVAVNHLLSTLDAFVSLRLRGGVGASRGSYQLSGSVPFR